MHSTSTGTIRGRCQKKPKRKSASSEPLRKAGLNGSNHPRTSKRFAWAMSSISLAINKANQSTGTKASGCDTRAAARTVDWLQFLGMRNRLLATAAPVTTFVGSLNRRCITQRRHPRQAISIHGLAAQTGDDALWLGQHPGKQGWPQNQASPLSRGTS